MWQDPIVAETRALREAYAAEFGYEPNAIFYDILKRQAQSGEKFYRFPPRKPRTEPVSRPAVGLCD